jgi:X-X-X-Leu-X-X-Gly heptad repeat protein
MNKTLLLIICDFLLLNLLALTHWEKAQPPRSAPPARTAATTAAAAPAVNADMVELMRVSLEDEKRTREELAAKLEATQGNLGEREKSLAQLSEQKTQLEGALNTTTANVKELEHKYSDATSEAFLSKEQLAKLQRELEEQRAAADRQAKALAAADRQRAADLSQIESLNGKLGGAEQARVMLERNLSDAKQQIDVERTERAKVQEQTTQLAQGVGQLAQKSGELSEEIRDTKPVNPNAIFADFIANRVDATIQTVRPGLFSPNERNRDTETILVTDGRKTYALMHVADTPFTLTTDTPIDYDKIYGRLVHGSSTMPLRELDFLAADPRIVVAPVDDALAAQLGAKIYRLATDIFKTSDALLVRAENGQYGETPFRIDAANPGYVKVDNRIVTRLFGEFSPKRGDLMFSKQGDLIGIMVNNDYCAVLGDFRALTTFQAGEDVAQPKTGPVFAALAARIQQMPPKLQ